MKENKIRKREKKTKLKRSIRLNLNIFYYDNLYSILVQRPLQGFDSLEYEVVCLPCHYPNTGSPLFIWDVKKGEFLIAKQVF